MCMAKAYLERGGEKELLLEDVTSLQREGNLLRLSTLFGATKEIEAVVVGIDFEAGSVLLEGLEHS